MRTISYIEPTEEDFYSVYRCGSDSQQVTQFLPTGFYEWEGPLALSWTGSRSGGRITLLKDSRLRVPAQIGGGWTLDMPAGQAEMGSSTEVKCSASWRLFIYSGSWRTCMKF